MVESRTRIEDGGLSKGLEPCSGECPPGCLGSPLIRQSVRAVFAALMVKRVRFLVAGGLAVNAFGVLRMTLDVDLVVELEQDNLQRLFDALESEGFLPVSPVSPEDLADSSLRRNWVKERNMVVLRFHSDRHRLTPVDVFVDEPFPFPEEWSRATFRSLKGVGDIPFVSLATLRRMKEAAGRPQDLADLDRLPRVDA